jgi:hypothetical protein
METTTGPNGLTCRIDIAVGQAECNKAWYMAQWSKDHIIRFWRDRYGWHASDRSRRGYESAYGHKASVELVDRAIAKFQLTDRLAEKFASWRHSGAMDELFITIEEF